MSVGHVWKVIFVPSVICHNTNSLYSLIFFDRLFTNCNYILLAYVFITISYHYYHLSLCFNTLESVKDIYDVTLYTNKLFIILCKLIYPGYIAFYTYYNCIPQDKV